jgi:hypothetical protein
MHRVIRCLPPDSIRKRISDALMRPSGIAALIDATDRRVRSPISAIKVGRPDLADRYALATLLRRVHFVKMSGRKNLFTTENQPAPYKRRPGNRSTVTTRRWLLADVDMRRPQGRRFVDLCKGYANEIGTDLTEAERTLVRQCAPGACRSYGGPKLIE